MKKYLVYSIVPFGILSFVLGCTGGQQSNDYMETDDSSMIQMPDTALYGHLGEGTGMSCLELITGKGDTIVLNKTDEGSGEYGLILGAIANYTDSFTIVTRNDNQSIKIALNINGLQQKWQSKSDRKKGFHLKSDGTAKALSQGQYKYNKWTLCNCQLIMLRESNGIHGSETRNDTLDILALTSDTLVLQNIHSGSPETFYHVQ